MKLFKNIIILFLLLTVFCTKEKTPIQFDTDDQFAIFLAKEHVQPWTELNSIELIGEPLITGELLKNYIWPKHQLTFSDDVLDHLQSWGDLLGRIFVVTVGTERIYWGVFLSDHFSSSWQVPVVRLFPDFQTHQFLISNTFIIDRAYPEYLGPSDAPDPRNNPKIFNCLLGSGKLIDN